MNILVTHYFTDNNRGDAAILEGVVVMLRKVFNIKRLRISTREHQYQRKDEYVTSFYYEAVDKIDSSLHRLFRIPYVLFVTTLYSFLYFVFEKKLSMLLTNDLLSLMNEYHTSDIVVLTGGGYITGKNTLYGNTNVILQLHGILIPFLLRKQIILFPQSIGPFGNAFQEFLASHILNMACLIMVREKESYSTVKKIGVKTRTLRAGDMAFLVESKKSRKINTLKEKYKENIIVGLTTKDWFSDKRQKIYERELAEFMDWVIAKYNANIFFIPQSVAKIQKDDDYTVLRKIKKLMKYGKDVFFIPDNLDHKELKAMYKVFDYLIGTRMHSNIFALTEGVPVIAIEYEYKTRGIMNDLGLSEWVVHINDVTKERLEALFTKLLQNSGSYKELLKVRVPTYKKQLLDSVETELRMFSKSQYKMKMKKNAL